MCGIAGIFRRSGSDDLGSRLRTMTQSILHRGPDADGHWVADQVALGHRRLSILDLSPTGNQPYSSANGRYKMVFNGELYNFQDVKQKITDHQFKSTGDTEVLMEAWSRWQLDALPLFKGMFAFAVWDQHEQALWLVRDRLGVKPVYYSLTSTHLVFGSEIRSVLASGLVKKELNQEAMFNFFSYQSVPGPFAIINGIQELKAGFWLKITTQKVESGQWWSIAEPATKYRFTHLSETRSKVRQLLSNAVAQRLVSDVPVGAFLSGGIDSSAVVALMAEHSNRPVETFNISFQEKAYDESDHASLVARKFNTHHHTILQQPEYVLDNLLPALDAMDTPSGDGINSYVVSKAIRDAGITVALSGIGGDELFAGYPFFHQFKQLQKFRAGWRLAAPLRHLAASVSGGGNSRKDRLSQLLRLPQAGIADVYPLFRQITSPSSFQKLFRSPGRFADPVQEALYGLNGLAAFPSYSQVSIAEYLGYTQYTLLKDTDQMSMAVSLEVREPFFDHELIEFVLQIPDDFKHPSYPKELLVSSLGDLLPPEIVHRKKQGFVFPWEVWMKTVLREFCEERLKMLAAQPYINGGELLGLWKRFLDGDKTIRWVELWLFVIFSHWMYKNGLQ